MYLDSAGSRYEIGVALNSKYSRIPIITVGELRVKEFIYLFKLI